MRPSGPAPVLLTAFAAAALVELAALAVGAGSVHTVAKPLLMLLLAGYAAARRGPRILVAALLFGWGGDVLLLSDADAAFLAGMGFFAAGHVCYLVLFLRRVSPREDRGARTALPYAAVLALLVGLLWPDLPGDLRIPVAGYSLLLTGTAWSATRAGVLAGAGGALFLLSDTLIATGAAHWRQPPGADFWVMLTYILAQYALVGGALGHLGPRPRPAAARP